MAKFKEKYIDTIICDQLGAFINGPAAAHEICDMAVQTVKGKVFVPEDVPFPDTVKVELPEEMAAGTPINVEIGFDLEPVKEDIRIVYPEQYLEVSEPAVSDKKVTFTVTPKESNKDTYTNVVFFYKNYTRVFHVDMLPVLEPAAPAEPEVPEVDGVKKSSANVKVGDTFNIIVSVDRPVESEADLEIVVDDKLEEVQPFLLAEGNMRLVGSYKAVTNGVSVVTAKTVDGKVTHQLNIDIAGEGEGEPAPGPGEEAEIKSVSASPESIAVGADSTITITFSKAPVAKPTLEVNEFVTVKTPLSVSETTGTAVVTGASAGAAKVTVKLGDKSQVADVTVTD